MIWLRQRRSLFLFAGLALVALTALGAVVNSRQFFVSWLAAEIFWLGIALGSMGWAMIHYLTGGKWGNPVRRVFEAAMSTLPLLLLGFIPICLGLSSLYPWATRAGVANDPVLQHRHLYMNAPGFLIRAALIFAVWILLSRRLLHLSARQDHSANADPTRRLRRLSGPGLVIYPLTGTLAFVDWIMSAECDWFSTMFPILICVGQMLAAIAFAICMLYLLRDEDPVAQVSGPEAFQQLGNLLLTLTMTWTYLAFSQFLIIWSGDLPREIAWYLHRTKGGWGWVVIALFLFHFLLPFFFLLSRRNKRRPQFLVAIAIVLLAAHAADAWWMVAPSFHPAKLSLHWMDLTAFAGWGAIWFSFFAGRLTTRNLLPVNDPRFALAAPANASIPLRSPLLRDRGTKRGTPMPLSFS